MDGHITPALATKNILHCELADPRVKLFGLAVLVTSLLNLAKNISHAFNRLLFSCADLRWARWALGRNLLDRLVFAQHLTRYSSLKRI